MKNINQTTAVKNGLFKPPEILKPKRSVISHIIKTTPQNFSSQVAKMQLNAGYKADNWSIATFRQLHLSQGSFLIQSLVNGRKSIFDFGKPVSEVEISDLEDFNARYEQRQLPPGISPFFTNGSALRYNLIHDKYTNNEDESHYHNYTQVASPRCKETGKEIFPLRQTAGVFSIPSYLEDIQVAVSEVEANSELEFKLNNGNILNYQLGDGKVMQLVVTNETLALIHQHPFCVIYQQENRSGIAKATLNSENQTVEWNFKGHETNPYEQIIVAPEGTARVTLKEI